MLIIIEIDAACGKIAFVHFPNGPQLIASEWSLAKGRRIKAQADRRC
jgi:hypothetical protein